MNNFFPRVQKKLSLGRLPTQPWSLIKSFWGVLKFGNLPGITFKLMIRKLYCFEQKHLFICCGEACNWTRIWRTCLLRSLPFWVFFHSRLDKSGKKSKISCFKNFYMTNFFLSISVTLLMILSCFNYCLSTGGYLCLAVV